MSHEKHQIATTTTIRKIEWKANTCSTFVWMECMNEKEFVTRLLCFQYRREKKLTKNKSTISTHRIKTKNPMRSLWHHESVIFLHFFSSHVKCNSCHVILCSLVNEVLLKSRSFFIDLDITNKFVPDFYSCRASGAFFHINLYSHHVLSIKNTNRRRKHRPNSSELEMQSIWEKYLWNSFLFNMDHNYIFFFFFTKR